jgi:POT family proton-dependent oligopeptide transporter
VENLFFIALLFLILGNGAFKPNISTQVGDLYPPGDPRRDRAFTIFYMGINLGAFFSPLVCGTLGQRLGWHYGFAAAGVGMVTGLVLYLRGQRYLAPETVAKVKQRQTEARRPLTRDEWRRVWALVTLCALNIVFWGVYEQQGNTLQLWADRNTNWSVLGVGVPSTWYQSFNPMIIFLFAPVLNILWAWQARRGREPGSVSKMAIGCFLLGASFLIMIAGVQGMGAEDRKSVLWLLSTTFVFTIGELYLSPIGLSLVTRVAPARIVSTMMGVWFLSYFFGNYLSGFLGSFWESMPREDFFGMLCLLGIGAGLAIWTFSRPLKAAVATCE